MVKCVFVIIFVVVVVVDAVTDNEVDVDWPRQQPSCVSSPSSEDYKTTPWRVLPCLAMYQQVAQAQHTQNAIEQHTLDNRWATPRRSWPQSVFTGWHQLYLVLSHFAEEQNSKQQDFRHLGPEVVICCNEAKRKDWYFGTLRTAIKIMLNIRWQYPVSAVISRYQLVPDYPNWNIR